MSLTIPGLEGRVGMSGEWGGTEVVIEDMRWRAAGLEELVRVAVQATLKYLDLEPEAYGICVLGCDDARITELNGEFRNQNRPTNVLSWPSVSRAPETDGGDPLFPDGGDLGDIAVSYGICSSEAVQQHRPFSDHVTHLVIHGLLHLLGYDHSDEGNAARMEVIENEILATLGIRSPY